MSHEMEYEGNSVESAIRKASEDLNVPAHELKHDVISYGSSGIFGLVGTKKARIRVKASIKARSDKAQASDAMKAEDLKCDTPETARSLVDATFDGDKNETEVSADLIEFSQDLLQRIVDFITTDAKVSVTEKNRDQILLKVDGGNSAILIGKRGQTLEAMQYLVEKGVNKNSPKRIRVEIDIEGYLENRKTNLLKLASRLAQKAKQSGKPMTVGQMNAHDRRIVHMALKDDKQIRTQSMGDGFNRKLVIFPKKNPPKNPDSALSRE